MLHDALNQALLKIARTRAAREQRVDSEAGDHQSDSDRGSSLQTHSCIPLTIVPCLPVTTMELPPRMNEPDSADVFVPASRAAGLLVNKKSVGKTLALLRSGLAVLLSVPVNGSLRRRQAAACVILCGMAILWMDSSDQTTDDVTCIDEASDISESDDHHTGYSEVGTLLNHQHSPAAEGMANRGQSERPAPPEFMIPSMASEFGSLVTDVPSDDEFRRPAPRSGSITSISASPPLNHRAAEHSADNKTAVAFPGLMSPPHGGDSFASPEASYQDGIELTEADRRRAIRFTGRIRPLNEPETEE